MAVVAAAERALLPLVATASRSGWHVVSGSTESMDPLVMTTLLLDAGVGAIMVGSGDPPAADDRLPERIGIRVDGIDRNLGDIDLRHAVTPAR